MALYCGFLGQIAEKSSFSLYFFRTRPGGSYQFVFAVNFDQKNEKNVQIVLIKGELSSKRAKNLLTFNTIKFVWNNRVDSFCSCRMQVFMLGFI